MIRLVPKPKSGATPELLAELVKQFPGSVRTDEPLERWTTFHCRSRAAAVISPRGTDDLVRLVRTLGAHRMAWGSDWTVIGRGSNLLVRDGGYPGVLVDLSEGFSRIEILEGDRAGVSVRAEAGVPNGTLLQWLRERNLSGFGFSFGIPGSVGGGIRMNAGTPLGWFGQIATQVEGVDAAGRNVSLSVTPDDFVYRDFPMGHDLIVTAARFRFMRAEPETVEAEITAAKEKRKNQPLDLPNIGSVFKNPPGDHAARLIEAAGLKGLRIGGAQISSKHSNFIVNAGGAKTADALELIRNARDAVRAKFGVTLEQEVHVIGVEA